MKESAIAGAVLIVALFLFCGFLANIGIFDAIEGRTARTEQLHDVKLKEVQAHAAAQATREALRINEELHTAALAQERQRLQLEQERQRAALYASSGAYSRAIADTVKPLGFAILWLGLPIMLMAWAWQRRRPLLTPQLLGSATTALERMVVDIERSRAFGVANKSPKTLSTTYAPKLTYQNKQDIQGADQLPAPAVAPSFRSLLDSGDVGSGKPLLLGYGPEGAIQGGWSDIYSAAVAGVTGSGKTTTTRFLAAQGALQGAQFAIIDPHAGAGSDSLAGTLAPLHHAFKWKPATEQSEILDMAALIEAEIDRRAGAGGGDRPLIVAVDELTALLKKPSLHATLSHLLERIAQEGRKLKVYGLLCGQIWSASRAGGTELRDSLASAYVHRIKRAQARYLLPTDEAANAERLATGSAMFYRTSGEIVTITIPNTTAADVTHVAQLCRPHLVARPPEVTTSEVLHNHFKTTSEVLQKPLQSTSKPPSRSTSEVLQKCFTSEREVPQEVLQPESLEVARRRSQVTALLEGGASQARILRDVWGVDGGPAWYAARDELNILKENLR